VFCTTDQCDGSERWNSKPEQQAGTATRNNKMEQKLARVFHALFPESRTLSAEMISVDSIPGWDSAAHVNLIAAIESEFDLFFDDVEALLKLTDFPAFKAYVGKAIALR
jgi:acyl carrier protein